MQSSEQVLYANETQKLMFVKDIDVCRYAISFYHQAYVIAIAKSIIELFFEQCSKAQ